MNGPGVPIYPTKSLKKKNYSKIQVGSPVDEAHARVLKKNVEELLGEWMKNCWRMTFPLCLLWKGGLICFVNYFLVQCIESYLETILFVRHFMHNDIACYIH